MKWQYITLRATDAIARESLHAGLGYRGSRVVEDMRSVSSTMRDCGYEAFYKEAMLK